MTRHYFLGGAHDPDEQDASTFAVPDDDPEGEQEFFEGSDPNPVVCWQCHGEGGFHDCGEDCCVCLDKKEIKEVCDVCDGEGWL